MFKQWSSIESTSKALRIKDKPTTKHHKTKEARYRELIDERAFGSRYASRYVSRYVCVLVRTGTRATKCSYGAGYVSRLMKCTICRTHHDMFHDMFVY